ncbi:Pentatricopeptide repeat-containing protein 10 [Durusdinium trenchii]|uniref:Chloroplastic (ZmPPR10) n=1 Tax=Durusdinium trenchii TaxID=1381693 RepID=A0ABP0S8U9_9DINO
MGLGPPLGGDEFSTPFSGKSGAINVGMPVGVISALMQGCQRAGAWETCVALLHTAQQQRLPYNLVSFNVTIDACQKGGAPWPVALELLKSIENSDVEANEVTWSSAIAACGKAAEWQRSLFLLHDARSAAGSLRGARGADSVRWQLVSFGAALAACAEGKAWREALGLFEYMHEFGPKPNVICANSLLNAFARSLHWEKAMAQLVALQERGPAPSVISFNTVMSACRSSWQRTWSVLQLMQDCSLANDSSFSTFIASLPAEQWRLALAVLQARPPGRSLPGSSAHATLLGLMADAFAWQEALLVFGGLEMPTSACFNSTMTACHRSFHWQAALRIFDQMKVAQRDASSYANACRAFAEAALWQRQLELLSSVYRSSAHLSVQLFDACLMGAAKTEHWQVAVDIFASMEAAGVQPDDLIRSQLMRVLGPHQTVLEKADWERFLARFPLGTREANVELLRQEETENRCETTPPGGPRLPPPQLEETWWLIRVDLGRTLGSFMPLRWATDGSRLLLPMIVRFQRGGTLQVHRAGDFLGEWDSPPSSAMGPMFWDTSEEGMKPEVTSGSWEMLDAEGGRQVQFNVRTTGFKRGSIWLPPRKLFFRGKVYGEILSGGKNATVSIRENLLLYGAGVAILLAFIWGPVSLVALVFFALRDVSISVGTWTCERLTGDPETEPLPPVTLKGDEPQKWI